MIRKPQGGVAAHGEDAQPNESLNKRRFDAPPAVRSTLPTRGRHAHEFASRGGRPTNTLQRHPARAPPATTVLPPTNTLHHRPPVPTTHATLKGATLGLATASSFTSHGLEPPRKRQRRASPLSPSAPRPDMLGALRAVAPSRVEDSLKPSSSHSVPSPPNIASAKAEASARGTRRGNTPTSAPAIHVKREPISTSDTSLAPPIASAPLSVPKPSPAPVHTPTSAPAPSSAQASFASGVRVKRERSSSPVIPARRPATSGVVRVELPPNCQKGASSYQSNRKVFGKAEGRRVRSTGLTVERILVRDDGLTIDWNSPVPVWSDTLERVSASALAPDITTASPPDQPAEPWLSPQKLANFQTLAESIVQAHAATLNAPAPRKKLRIARQADVAEVIDVDATDANVVYRSTSSGSNGPRGTTDGQAASSERTPEWASLSTRASTGVPGRQTTGDSDALSPPPLSSAGASRSPPGKSAQHQGRSASASFLLLRNELNAHVVNGNDRAVTGDDKRVPLSPAARDSVSPQRSSALAASIVDLAPATPKRRAGGASSQNPTSLHDVQSDRGQHKHDDPGRAFSLPNLLDRTGDSSGEDVPSQAQASGSVREGKLPVRRDRDVIDMGHSPMRLLSSSPMSRYLDIEEDERARMEDDAIEYLKRWVRTFETDRAALAEAYAHDATFSLRYIGEHGSRLRGRVTPALHANGELQQGPLSIISALRSLGPALRFCTRGQQASFNYDVSCLRKTLGVLLVWYSEVEDKTHEPPRRLSVHQSLVLRDIELDAATKLAGSWPLRATSHQMIVRDLAFVSSSSSRQ